MRRRYVQINGELIEVTNDYSQEPRAESVRVIPDIQPYKSMQTGEMVTSRSRHREILRQYGLVEVGNEIDAATKKQQPRMMPREERRRLIADIINSRHHNIRY